MMLRAIALAVIVTSAVAAQTLAPDRTVQGSSILSTHDPHIEIQLPSSAIYIGADRWPLYDVADCELHAFVDADPNKNVRNLYWVQFEGYLPTKPDSHYTYDSPRHIQIGGLDFFVDTWVRADGEQTRSGSDREHIEAHIHAHGYKMPAGMMYVRLVHLLDEQKRKELMIIYGEDLAPTGFTTADLQPNGKAYSHWPELEQDLIERAKQKIQIHPL
jgi:hypothetical protein